MSTTQSQYSRISGRVEIVERVGKSRYSRAAIAAIAAIAAEGITVVY